MEIFTNFVNNIFDVSTTDRVAWNKRFDSIKELGVLLKLKLDRHQKSNNFIINRMIKLQNFLVSFEQNAWVQGVLLIYFYYSLQCFNLHYYSLTFSCVAIGYTSWISTLKIYGLTMIFLILLMLRSLLSA